MPHAGPRLKDGTSPWPEGSRHPYLPQVFQNERRNDKKSPQDQSPESPGSSGYAASNSDNPYTQPRYHPSHTERPQGQYTTLSGLTAKGPLGAIPQVDWGTVDMSARALTQLPPVTNAEPYSFGGFASMSKTPSPMPPIYTTTSHEQQMHGTSTPPASAPPEGTAGTSLSPTDALINDIDWVSAVFSTTSFKRALDGGPWLSHGIELTFCT